MIAGIPTGSGNLLAPSRCGSIQGAQPKKCPSENFVSLIAVKTFTFTLVVCAALLAGCSSSKPSSASKARLVYPDGLVLTGTNRLVTPTRYQPPVDIRIVAKTDTTNLRLGYAADQVVFNWEMNPDELRINGGPADQKHKAGAGKIPANQFVDIRWVVNLQGQQIFVDGQLRYEDKLSNLGLNRPVSVFPAVGSIVTVKKLEVTPLKQGNW